MGRHRGVEKKERGEKSEGKDVLPCGGGWGSDKEKEEREHDTPTTALSFICPWMALSLQVRMEIMHLVA